MDVKLFEIRDKGTFIAAMATRLMAETPVELWLLLRAGYSGTSVNPQLFSSKENSYVILTKLDGVESQYDSFSWPNSRTMGNAHRHIIQHWDALESGDVLDVEYILGETKEPKRSER